MKKHVVWVGLALTIWSILAFISFDLPFSPLFSHYGNDVRFVHQLLEENEIRLLESKKYLHQYEERVNRTVEIDPNVSYDIVIVIITMELRSNSKKEWRNGRRNFLTQTLGSLLKELNDNRSKLFKTLKVTLCNVNTPSNKHFVVQKYSRFIEVFSRNGTELSSEDELEKETDDYRFCIDHISSKYKPKYLLVLEDDVVMKQHCFSTLEYFVQHFHNHANESDWLSVKLYHPKKWSGYSNEAITISELMATSLVLGFCISLLSMVFTCKFEGASILTYVFFTVVSLLSCLILGRQNVMRWRSYFYFTHQLSEAQGCCTQAMLFNHIHVPLLVNYLKRIKSLPQMAVDLAITEFAQTCGLKQYMIQPNICQHIGFISTLSKDTHVAIDFL